MSKCFRLLALLLLTVGPMLMADTPVFRKQTTFSSATPTPSGTKAAPGPDDGINLPVFTGADRSLYYRLYWYPIGAPASCTVAVDSSVDSITWSAGGAITGQTCTSPGSITISTPQVFNWVRMNVTALTANRSVIVTLVAYENLPSGVGPVLNVALCPGADLGAKLTNCIAALPSTGGVLDARSLGGAQTITTDTLTGVTKPLTIMFGASTITVSATQTIQTNKISLIGLGPSETIWSCTVNGDCLRVLTTPFTADKAGTIYGIKFDGTGNAGANAVGIHAGDIIGLTLDNVWVTVFGGANSACYWFDNTTNWTEQLFFNNNRANNCSKVVRWTVNGGTNSFLYGTYPGNRLEIFNTQTALSIEGTATVGSSVFDFTINKSGNASGTILSMLNTSVMSSDDFHIIAENTGGGGGTGISTAAGTTLAGRGIITPAGLTNSISGTVSQTITDLGLGDANGLIVSNSTIASRFSSPALGTYLMPEFNAASFRMGLGINLHFDGTNWVTGTDGGSNGGTAILGSFGSPTTMQFFVVPTTGGTVQTITNANLTANNLKATIDTNGITTPQLTSTTIKDGNGNPFLLSTATASAVDSITVTNAATANPATVTVGSSGTDTNINLALNAKGSGVVSHTTYTQATTNGVYLTADWTCGTGGTVSSCVAATIIGSGGGVAWTFTLPTQALSWQLDCWGVVGQATAATLNQWNLLTATNGATNVIATYDMFTAATTAAAGAVTGQAATTTTFQIAPSWTLGATGTKMPFHIHARVEGASTSGTVLSVQLVAPTVGDLVTIYRGSGCRVF